MLLRHKYSKWLPHSLVAIWLMFLALTIWAHARKTDLPPFYDAGTYFLKAHNVWRGLHLRHFVNPLNAEPESRGPGTVVMSYPFGFNPDFRPFYFRSVYFPILGFVAGLYLAAFDPEIPFKSQWNVAILAIFFSCLPLFYHFEMSDLVPGPVFWGLVDNFLAGVTALAAGATVRSLRNHSLRWWVLGVLIASFSLLTKPAGAVLMLAIDAAWGCALIVDYLQSNSGRRDQVWRFLLKGALLAAPIQAATVFACLHSKYLSSQNIATGAKSLRTFQTYFRSTVTLSFLHTIISGSFGYVLPFTTGALVVAGIVGWRHALPERKQILLTPLIVGAAIILIAGLWFWVIETEISQDRYFYPFGTAAIVFSAPAILAALSLASSLPTQVVRTLWLLPCANLALLLLQSNAPVKWQQLSGVSLVSGGQASEVAQATELLSRITRAGKDATAYAMDLGTSPATFSSVAAYESVIEPEKPHLIIQFPIDWQTGSMYQLSDIANSNFLIFQVPSEPARDRILSTNRIEDFAQEGNVIGAWLSQLTPADGLTKLSETSVRVAEVTDRSKLEASFDKLVGQHLWPARFVEENPKTWWSANELRQVQTTLHPQITKVKFEDILEVSALSVERGNGSITISLWWKWLGAPQEGWKAFCHVIDQNGAILDNHDVVLNHGSAPSNDRLVRLTRIDFENTRLNGAYGVAFGVYAPGVKMLKADSGKRDWNNYRVIVPFKRTT